MKEGWEELKIVFIMKEILIVGAGSCLGGMLRYIVSLALKNISTFPLGTFTVNIIGCFLIGLLWSLSSKHTNLSNEISLFLMVGFCGGFTTFSTFSKESLSLLSSEYYLPFLLYSIGSIVLGILAVAIGYRIS